MRVGKELKWLTKERRWKLTLLKITPEEYLEVCEDQDGHCAICWKLCSDLVLDHDHDTGKFRSLLCRNCNAVLGNAKENVNTLRKAIEYLAYKDGTMMTMPEWIDPEAWAGYVEMRQKLKKPLTDRAKRMAIRKLEDFRSRGHDPNAILDESTFKSWLGLYEPNAVVPMNVYQHPTYRDAQGRLYKVTAEGSREYIQ